MPRARRPGRRPARAAGTAARNARPSSGRHRYTRSYVRTSASGVVVALVEPGARPHVQQVLHGRALQRGAFQLRYVLLDAGRDVQQAAARQYPRDRRGHRLGHRHQQARYVRRHAVEIVLGHDPALVQDEEPVGVGLPEQLGHGPLVVRPADLKAEDVALGAWQRPGGPGSARDPGRGDQLADVLERSPVERRVLPVRQRYLALRAERRRPCHRPGIRHRIHAGYPTGCRCAIGRAAARRPLWAGGRE